MPVSALIRSAVFCSDLDRSTAFYRALGLDAVYYEGDLDPEKAGLGVRRAPHCVEGARD